MKLSVREFIKVAPEKVFLEVARKLLEFTLVERSAAGSHLATGGASSQRGPGGENYWSLFRPSEAGSHLATRAAPSDGEGASLGKIFDFAAYF